VASETLGLLCSSERLAPADEAATGQGYPASSAASGHAAGVPGARQPGPAGPTGAGREPGCCPVCVPLAEGNEVEQTKQGEGPPGRGVYPGRLQEVTWARCILTPTGLPNKHALQLSSLRMVRLWGALCHPPGHHSLPLPLQAAYSRPTTAKTVIGGRYTVYIAETSCSFLRVLSSVLISYRGAGCSHANQCWPLSGSGISAGGSQEPPLPLPGT